LASHVAVEPNAVRACVLLEVDAQSSVEPKPKQVRLLLISETQSRRQSLPSRAEGESRTVYSRVVRADVGRRLTQRNKGLDVLQIEQTVRRRIGAQRHHVVRNEEVFVIGTLWVVWIVEEHSGKCVDVGNVGLLIEVVCLPVRHLVVACERIRVQDCQRINGEIRLRNLSICPLPVCYTKRILVLNRCR